MGWLTGWDYKIPIEIQGASVGAQTEYPIKLSVTYTNAMQPDFDDIRFTSDDGISQLLYYRESYTTSTSGIFWIKVPYIPVAPNATGIYMYYGNNFVSTTSSISSIFTTISGISCCWSFDETSGTVIYDKSGNNRNGTLYNGPTRVAGKYDNALYLDGVNDYMIWSYTSKPSNNFSLSFWMKAITTHEIDAESETGTAGVAFQKYIIGSTQEGIYAGLGVSAGTNGISVYAHGNSYMPAIAVYNTTIGTSWKHVVVTVTNKQPKIYVDSVLVRTGLTCSKTYLYAPSTIGYCPSGFGHFNGYIDEAYVFNYTLSQAQITTLYNSRFYISTSSGNGLCYKYVYPEPIASINDAAVGNIFSNSQYIFSCSMLGINVYDFSTKNLLNHVLITGTNVSSIWGNSNYLFIGTNSSGIYRRSMTTITGTDNIEIFKQYPNIINNNVKYLHGAGDYLCAATISGIDRYNLISDERIYTTASGINKCFQIDDGTYYYSLYTDLHVLYEDVTSHTYTPAQGNILQSYCVYNIANDYTINDLYVTKDTSIHGGNTIFLATNHGVVVIEEKRGDEENARHRYYLKST